MEASSDRTPDDLVGGASRACGSYAGKSIASDCAEPNELGAFFVKRHGRNRAAGTPEDSACGFGTSCRRRRAPIVLAHRRQAQNQLDRPQHAGRRVERVVDGAVLHERTGHEQHRTSGNRRGSGPRLASSSRVKPPSLSRTRWSRSPRRSGRGRDRCRPSWRAASARSPAWCPSVWSLPRRMID